MLQRAQLVLILSVLLPTILMTALGIVLLAVGSQAVAIVSGVLVLAFCASAITGYILGSIFMSRGASLARVQNDFLSSVSHELRTPITSLQMFLDTLRDDRVTDPAERRRCLDIMKRELSRLDALVSRLLELSRIEAGRRSFEFALVELEGVVEDAMVALQAASLGNEPRVEVALEPGLTVRGDRTALAQALANLLINAWKYTPEHDKRIRVDVRALDRRRLELVVSDNGPGIPKQEHRAIFEKFERGSAARGGARPGSGLGLAVVKAIVDVHRGRIAVRSDTRQGSEFSIVLPRVG
jgi:two-component system phosphate regulon sensor histidine kinase PhoR